MIKVPTETTFDDDRFSDPYEDIIFTNTVEVYRYRRVGSPAVESLFTVNYTYNPAELPQDQLPEYLLGKVAAKLVAINDFERQSYN